MQRPGILIFYCTEQEEQTNILTTDGQYGRVGRPSRGENRRHCPSIHAQPRPMERLVNTRHWRGKTDTGPIEELPFFKVRSLNLHLQRFFCRSLVDKITFFLLRCPASPCLSLLLPCPAPQILKIWNLAKFGQFPKENIHFWRRWSLSPWFSSVRHQLFVHFAFAAARSGQSGPFVDTWIFWETSQRHLTHVFQIKSHRGRSCEISRWSWRGR